MTPGTVHKSKDLSERALGAVLLAPAALLLLVVIVVRGDAAVEQPAHGRSRKRGRRRDVCRIRQLRARVR